MCAGTFTDLKRGRVKDDIGFTGETAAAKSQARITVPDLEEYGLIAELLGRLPVITELDTLSDVEMSRIITDPPDCLLREYRENFSFENITVDLRPEAISQIVALARERKTGARGLRAIFEELFHDLSFNAPDHAGKPWWSTPLTCETTFIHETRVSARAADGSRGHVSTRRRVLSRPTSISRGVSSRARFRGGT
ncbi:MAG: hypothetical protein M5R36_11350 [Deltaproteobacteria bacterium]|nr:hypothetical protein [Deltaproteobacteria bacterium]